MDLKSIETFPLQRDVRHCGETFPLQRDVRHCGETFQVSPFDIYADCPRCGTRIKMRSFAGGLEIEDVFDAVFAWRNQPGAEELIRRR